MLQRIDNQACYDGNIEKDQDDQTYDGADGEAVKMDHGRMWKRAWGSISVEGGLERQEVRPGAGGFDL